MHRTRSSFHTPTLFLENVSLGLVLATLASQATLATEASADNRRFAYLYSAGLPAAGVVEFEQWVTVSGGRASNPGQTKFNFREEIEVGITDKFALGIYLADWQVVTGGGQPSETTYKDSAIELRYQLQDPLEEKLGVTLYGELKVGNDFLKLEGATLFEVRLDSLTLCYNLFLEAEWEGEHYSETEGELKNLWGASLSLDAGWAVGGEMVLKNSWEQWRDANDPTLQMGPNVTYRKGRWFATTTCLFQVTDVDSAADWEVRLITGWEF